MRRTLSLLTALVAGLGLAGGTQAASSVLFDVGLTGQQLEDNAVGITNGAGNFGPTNLATDLGNLIVELTNGNTSGGTSGGLDWRDRGDSTDTSTNTLINIGEDFVKNNSGFITMSITGLPAGTYDATSWHVDPDFDQSSNIQVNVDVMGGGLLLTGAMGDASQNIGGVDNLTTAIMDASAAMFSFQADGLNPVIIVWDGNTLSADNETPLNGLLLVQQVPEPVTATLGLFGLAGLGLATRRRRA